LKYPYCVSFVSVCGMGVKRLALPTIEPVYEFSRKLTGTSCYWIPLLRHTFQSLPAKITIWRTYEYMSERCLASRCYKVRHDTARYDKTRHDMIPQDTTWHDTTRPDTTWHNTARHGTTRHDTTHDMTRYYLPQLDTARHDATRHDTTRRDTTRHDTCFTTRKWCMEIYLGQMCNFCSGRSCVGC